MKEALPLQQEFSCGGHSLIWNIFVSSELPLHLVVYLGIRSPMIESIVDKITQDIKSVVYGEAR